MYELIQAGANTYYIDCPSKIGIYKLNASEVCLIDSGNDKDAGKKALRILEAKQWKLNRIINTHSHADHIGGNRFLQEKTGCRIFARGIEKAFSEYPILESVMLYGGYPCRPLRNKFLLAQPSRVEELTEANLPEGLAMLPVEGHSFSMTAIRTDDDVWFLADCITDAAILKKYHVAFLYDVRETLNTLQNIGTLKGRLFVPSHGNAETSLKAVIDLNRKKIQEICDLLVDFCEEKTGPEELTERIFEHYGLTMDLNQYVLVGSTIRSYLSYLQEEHRIEPVITGSRLYWHSTEGMKEKKGENR